MSDWHASEAFPVVVDGQRRFVASCAGCGWSGELRERKRDAEYDAYDHDAQRERADRVPFWMRVIDWLPVNWW